MDSIQKFDALQPGLTREYARIVEEKHVVTHTGVSVLSTPMMISMMERVCMDLMNPILPPGFTTVGYEVNVRHKAPAPLGSSLNVFCRLMEAEGRRFLFEVRVSSESTLIGEGIHRRTIIPVAG